MTLIRIISAIGFVASTALASTVVPSAAQDFPPDQFPPSVYGNLQGPLVVYDPGGGALIKARLETIGKDFTKLTGVELKHDFNGDNVKFFAAMENGGQIPWSVVEFATEGDFLRAKAAGDVEKLDSSIVPLNKLVAGTYDEYGFPITRYGINLVYNTTKFPDKAKAPSSLGDLMDTKRFPGKRCLFKYPQFGATLEAALLGDGVPRDKLYPLDVDRAFKKLDTIKDDIVWWSGGDEAIRLLTTGECDLGVAWSGRVYTAVTNDHAPLAIVWNDALYANGVFAIPKGAPNPKAGEAFLAMWLSDIKGQRDFVSKIPYTTPIAQLEKEGYPEALGPWLVAGHNVEVAIPENGQYYAEHLKELLERFNTWVATP